MTVLRYDAELRRFAKTNHPGSWKGARSDGGRTALVCCPKCGAIASLIDHAIGDDGVVSPSLVCPYPGCDFHDFVRLDDWPATVN